MTDLEPTTTIVVPVTGELVDLTNPNEVAHALDAVRDAKRHLDDIRTVLERALLDESARQGTKTLHLDGVDAVISGGVRVEYDTLKLQILLRELGLPEPRLAEAVVETVTYKADARVLKQLAGANPGYADAIGVCRQEVEVPWRVTIKRR